MGELSAVQFGATKDASPDDIEEAKRQTHDLVIQMAGELRTTGVSWVLYQGDRRFEILRIASDMYAENPDDLAAIRALQRFCEENPHGVLVAAECGVEAGAHDA